jgi:hypothetical protein
MRVTGRLDPLEAQLCELAADVLGVGEVPPEADFFALGGDADAGRRLVRRIGE